MNKDPLIQFVDELILKAHQENASDIHLEPYANQARIRFRQQGILQEISIISLEAMERLTLRLKVIANLDIAERRLPQDGSFKLTNLDIRISTCPTTYGEKVVLRILHSNAFTLQLFDIGLTPSQIELFTHTLNQPQGLILVTGPTGCGKTVTLYSALNYLNTSQRNISTIEDPVEMQIYGINQIAINSKINLGFSNVLRTLLRQDPDIIMVGEIRDDITANLAIHASHTGHLVLSTLHSNTAIEAISRLRHLTIQPYQIAESLTLVISQRLLRKLCIQCKILTNENTYIASNCSECCDGYVGRIAIFEMLSMTPDLARHLHQRRDIKLFVNNHASLKDMALNLMKDGVTSLDEVKRVIML